MKGLIRIVIFGALIAATAPVSARGQEVYSSMRLDVSLAADVSEGRLQDHWRIGPSPAVRLQMPFYVGAVEIGASGARNTYRNGVEADYWSALIHGGWGEQIDIGEVVRAGGSVLVGSYFMVFDSRQVGYARRENELALGASADLSLLPLDPVIIFGRANYVRVFTSHPIDLVQVSAGLGLRLDTPDWLRTLLR